MHSSPHAAADAAFLAVLPTVLRHARIQFRDVACVHERSDLTQEVLAYALRWSRLLWSRGKDVREFPSPLARYAVLAVKSGRRLCGMHKAKDAMNPSTQTRVGFTCAVLALHALRADDPVQIALAENARSDVSDQVAFRIDFPTWLASRTERDRAIIADMLREERTLDLARKHRVSQGRVSQLRKAYAESWQAFHGELD
jgi:hypothetical protein